MVVVGCSEILRVMSIKRKRRHTVDVCGEEEEEECFPMEEACTNTFDTTCASSIHDPRKRKKETEMSEVQGPGRANLNLDWKQEEQDVFITTKLGAGDGDADKVQVFFTEQQMTIKLADGREQCWCFHGAIDETQSVVKRKKRRFTITVVKKEAGLWPALEAVENAETWEPPAAENKVDSISPDNDASTDSLQEVRTKEEEPVLNLQYIKHDFFEKEDMLTVHIYVKNVSKDAVKIHFDKQSFTVKFQSGDARFLQLHEGASEDTVFCWTINTKNQIRPPNCKYKITGNFIELSLKKASTDRWATLEAPLKKETTPAPKSTSWMPATKTGSSVDASSGSSGSSSNNSSSSTNTSVFFDEMSQIDANRREPLSNDASTSSHIYSAKNQAKPTAKVQPLNKQVEEVAVVPPGFTGLDNLGNTCFMNSVIQVLANTYELRDYFLGGQFQHDINRESGSGTGGELAVCFGVLLKVLWKGTRYSVAPSKLKALISKRWTQFTGFAQHDAQEFLGYLLDGLHEDVNRVKKKPSAQALEDIKKPDHVLADERWSAYRRREDSFFVDLLHGMYRLKITCPSCNEVSISFDPFSVLPLHLPKKRKMVTLTFMWRDPHRKPVKYSVQLVKDSSVEHLTVLLSQKTGVHSKNMRVFEVCRSLFSKRYTSSNDLSAVGPNDTIVVCEVLSAETAGEEVVEVEVIQRTLVAHQYPVRCSACHKECKNDTKLKRCTKCLKVGYCDQTCQRTHWQSHRVNCNLAPEPVGCPFYLSLPRSHCTYSRIARLMESFARYSVDTFQPPIKTTPTTTPPATTATATASTTTATATNPAGTCGSMLPPGGDLQLPSQTSVSNLSSSSGSQSSGSLSSLDSISSCSSTATLTAETPQATFDLTHSGEDEDEEKEVDESGEPCVDEQGGGDVDSGIGSTSAFQNGTASQTSCYSAAEGDCGTDKASCSASERSASGSNVQSVAASMSTERSVPLFFIKPVASNGRGRRELDRLEDKGDTVLDMSPYSCLSMDWRNNEKLDSYVLVQSKELESEEDESVKTALSVSENLTLEQCLDNYHAPEVLTDREAWTCPKCKEKQAARQQHSIWRLPHIFIIQLKRFSHFFFSNKIDKMVEFPVRGLDMTPFMSNHKPGDPPVLYDLYGVINHMGGVLGGHYTNYTRCVDPTNPNRSEVDWRLCDDSRVTSVSKEDVVKRSAYVLFYRRRQPFVPPVIRPMAPVEPQSKEENEKEKICEKKEDPSLNMIVPPPSDVIVKEEVQEKCDIEKKEIDDEEEVEDDNDLSSQGEGCLVMDLEPGPSPPLDYTDMDAVD